VIEAPPVGDLGRRTPPGMARLDQPG